MSGIPAAAVAAAAVAAAAAAAGVSSKDAPDDFPPAVDAAVVIAGDAETSVSTEGFFLVCVFTAVSVASFVAVGK